MKTIHSKKMFRDDLQYARQMMRRIENAIRNNDWETVVEEATELEPLFSAIRANATDNREGIRDFDCKFADQIEAEREAIREAERARWQKIADKVCVDLTATTGIEWTGAAR